MAEVENDGFFPLITNELTLSERDLLLAYKGQPALERRFAPLKTDFEVAPVHVQAVSRIAALLCVYFFVLLVEALLERELRRAMAEKEIEGLPLYPEGRACRRPTARKIVAVRDLDSGVPVRQSGCRRGISRCHARRL